MIDRAQDKPVLSYSTAPATVNTGPLTHCLVACVQLALLALIYWQTHSFGLVYYDDGEYVSENAPVLAGLTMDSIRWAFTSFYMSNWHPLTWISHMLDASLFGPDPGWAHLHNVVLHGINSMLFYALALKLSGNWWRAGVLSLVFLAHPLHVESVAWIAERKDLLSAFFFLLGVLLYNAYRDQATKLRYAGVLICFALALMAKPMAITFPVVLLILDIFVYRDCFQIAAGPNSRGSFNYTGAIVEKLPLLALSAASAIVTLLAQHAGNSVATLAEHSFSSRCVTALIAYFTYLRQFVLPVNLAAFYPIDLSVSFRDSLVPLVALLALVTLAVSSAIKRPLLAAGICWYLVTLLPVIGLVQVGSQAHADRYMYIPSMGLLLACSYLLPSRTENYFQLASILAIIFIVYLSVLSFFQVTFWSSRHSLFSRVIEVVGPNYLAHIHLAHDFLERGMLGEAKQHSQAALKLGPGLATPYLTLGDIALAEKDYAAAEELYRITLTKNHPPVERILINIGITRSEQGDLPAGIEALEDALKINPASGRAQTILQYYRNKLAAENAP
jgi:protein O-mannosyl-transferase